MKIAFTRIYILLLFLAIVGCQKEEITTDIITEMDDPTEIKGPVFTGLVVNEDGIAVANTDIEIYQGGELLGTTKSRNDGSYSTIDIPIKSSEDVHLFTKKDGMVSKLKIVPAEQKEVNLNIYSQEGALFALDFDSPGDTTLIKVSGNILTESNQPAAAIIFGLYDVVSQADGSVYASGSLVYTDEDGYYEYYVPNDRNSHFLAFERYCGKKWLSEEEDIVGNFLATDLIEQNAQDTILPTIADANDLNLMDIAVSGVLLDCEGTSPIANDTFRMRVRDEQINSELFDIITDANGNFENTFKICSDILYYEIWTDDGLIYQSEAVEGTEVDLGSINKCAAVKYDSGSSLMTILKGSFSSFFFEGYSATIVGNNYEITFEDVGQLNFVLEESNEIQIDSFSFVKDAFDVQLTATEENIIESTVEFNDDVMIVNINSTLIADDGTEGSVNIKMSFKD